MSYPVMSTSMPWSLVKSGFKKSPSLNSVVQKTAAGRGNSGFSLKPFPTWMFELDLNYVLGGESVAGSVLQSFLGCFIAAGGQAGLFQFTDPNDNAVTDASGVLLNTGNMGVKAGDGASTTFQLARTIDQGVDVLQNVTITDLKVGGVAKALGTDYSVSASGVITFVSAPANLATLTWGGSFTYLCRFADDNLQDLARVSKNSAGFLWTCGAIKFESEFV